MIVCSLLFINVNVYSSIGKTNVEIKVEYQKQVISGLVLDELGVPLPTVSIVLVGTTVGTQTDFDGRFEIKAVSGDVLEFSYIGYKTQGITLSSNNTFNVIMKEDSELSRGVRVLLRQG